MVSDENYFTTLIKNSPMCGNHVNRNFLHVQFDQWENEKGGIVAKCLQPNPKHCGRSPTTLTAEYLPVLELGQALFARKFDVNHDGGRALDAVDAKRAARDAPSYVEKPQQYFRGVRISRREGGRDYCVTATTGGRDPPVVLEACDAANKYQKFNVGPCSSDGDIELRPGAPASVAPGAFAPAPFCPVASAAADRLSCLDLKGEQITAGTALITYQCSGRWNQLFGLGTGARGAPDAGTLFINIPFANHPIRYLCAEADALTNGDALGTGEKRKLRVEECHSGPTQTFSVSPLRPPV